MKSKTRIVALSTLGVGVVLTGALYVYFQAGTQAGWLQSPLDDGGSWLPTILWAVGIALIVVGGVATLWSLRTPRRT